MNHLLRRLFPHAEAWLTPAAIVLGSIIIASSIALSGEKRTIPPQPGREPVTTLKIPALNPSDHVLGNRNAPVIMIEYSDTECPFCKRFHSTLQKIMKEYGSEGDVAWAFRHFPVHKKSMKEGHALECAAELGGNEVFWKYADRIFEETSSNDSLDLGLLRPFAADLGLDVEAFGECLESGKYDEKMTDQRSEADAAGAKGTPWTVIVSKGRWIPLNGAVPYETVESIVKEALRAR
ncbi:MAG: thioredoxin domain-containing protein [Candidatus Taylorbacteria bacterium]|nr:thioredoxin domain-containing protein [Candidatus Taylorbacteria bacterium]